MMRTLLLLVVLLCASCSAPQRDADGVAQRLLDESATEEARAELVTEHVDGAAAVLSSLLEGMEPGTEEEYRRIPWIWRVSRAAGETNDADIIMGVLEISTPHDGAPLRDWQAVVLGGGIVSGLSAAGEWPGPRLEQLVQGELRSRFDRAVELAAVMADDPTVPDPTRYDALRLLAVAGWDVASPQLIRYLDADVHDELQMGAVSALGDIPEAGVDSVLISRFAEYAPYNRKLALDHLTRSSERAESLIDAIERGTIHPDSLRPEHVDRLIVLPETRERARRVLSGR